MNVSEKAMQIHIEVLSKSGIFHNEKKVVQKTREEVRHILKGQKIQIVHLQMVKDRKIIYGGEYM